MGKVKNKIAINLSSKTCTQSELAEIVGVNQSAIARYMRGDVEPSLDVLIKLAHALNITTDELLGVSIKTEPTSAEEDSALTADQKGIIAIAKKLPPRLANKAYGYLLGLIDATSDDSDINKII